MGESAFEAQLFFIAAAVQLVTVFVFGRVWDSDPADWCELGWSWEVTIYLISFGFFIHTLSDEMDDKFYQSVIVVSSTAITLSSLVTSLWASQALVDCGRTGLGGFWACVALMAALKCLSCLVHLRKLSASQKCKKKEGKWKLRLRSVGVSCALGYMICDVILDNTVESSIYSWFFTLMLLCAELYAALLAQISGLIFFIAHVLVGGVGTCYLLGLLFTLVVLTEKWAYGPQQLLFLVGIGAETLLKIWERGEEKKAEKEHQLLLPTDIQDERPPKEEHSRSRKTANCLFALILWVTLIGYCWAIISWDVYLTIVLVNHSDCFSSHGVYCKNADNSTSPVPSASPSLSVSLSPTPSPSPSPSFVPSFG